MMPQASDVASQLRPLFEPESVAVVGASRDPSKPGSMVVRNLISFGFKGKIFPVNPKADEILGLKTYPKVDLITEAVETIVVVTPAAPVPQIMRDCEKKGVKAAIILSGGFSEEGEEGARIAEEMLRIAKRAGIRILGPNTTGVVNTGNGFTSSFVPFSRLPKGNVAFIAQTGNFGGVVCEQIVSSGIFGLSKVVGMGNKYDVTDADVLEYLAQDPQTRVIAIYMEGLRDGQRFIDVCRRVTKKKPVFVVKGGKTKAGATAALSHTGSMSGEDKIFTSACKQAGVIRASEFERMLDSVKTISLQPLPKDRRVALMHFSGALCVLASDMIVEAGLEIARLSEDSLKRLREVTPDWHRITNPIDLIPSIQTFGAQKAYEVAIDTVIKDEGVDSVIIGMGLTEGNYPNLKQIDLHADKPLLFDIYGNKEIMNQMAEYLQERGLPVYDSTRRAVNVLIDMHQAYEAMHKP